MINFFRKIRQNPLNEGKTSRYFKYAIGEILLVVIGILIALQINNWNSQRNERIQELLILKSLKTDYTDNLNNLLETKAVTVLAYNACLRLLELIDPIEINYTNNKVDNLLIPILNYYTYDPTTGVIDEIINSGKLNIIQNQELKNQLSNWSRLIADLAHDITISNDHLFKVLVIYLERYANLKNLPVPESIYSNTNLQPAPHSNFITDYKNMMTSLEFENMINWHSVNLIYIVNEYEEIQIHLESTIELIKSEINNHD